MKKKATPETVENRGDDSLRYATTPSLRHQPALLSAFPRLVAAQSTRHGGVSSAPFASLNLGLRSGDEAGNVLENRRRFFGGLGIETDQVALSHQVHGDRILLAETPGNYEGYDALVTGRPGLFVAVLVADCVPVLVYDARQRAVAAIHAGWRGTVASIVFKTLQKMAEHFGTRSADCYAYVGTCIDECSFEVDRDVADAFEAAFKRWDEAKQKYFIHLKAANAAQLRQFGISDDRIEISPYSTVLHNQDYFSYRKEGSRSGRMMAVIGVRE